MKILGLEKLSLVDFPGYTCAVVFTGGCNFKCPFCHNSGLVLEDVAEISEHEVFEYLEKRYGLLDAVCVSGGEPTLQNDLINFLKRLKDIGYKVKLDTNGSNPKILKEIINLHLVDYVAMDIKNNFADYNEITGIKCLDISKIIESVDILKENKVDYEFRTTLVKEFHNRENIIELANDLKSAKKLYLQRFVDNDNCIGSGLHEIPKDVAESYLQQLSGSIEAVLLRGYV